jgi:hypothetical protein
LSDASPGFVIACGIFAALARATGSPAPTLPSCCMFFCTLTFVAVLHRILREQPFLGVFFDNPRHFLHQGLSPHPPFTSLRFVPVLPLPLCLFLSLKIFFVFVF